MAFLRFSLLWMACLAFLPTAEAERLKDLVHVDGMHHVPLVGYGIVLGLNGDGDSATSSPFTIQSIASMLNRLGVNVQASVSKMRLENAAAVMVTAELPAQIHAGQRIDVTVSSIGDASSLRGGTLLVAPLLGSDGQVYAIAQGALSVGGLQITGKASSRVQNHPTVGIISDGALVKTTPPRNMNDQQDSVLLALHQADFTTAKRIEMAINQHLGQPLAKALDPGTIRLWNPEGKMMDLMYSIENIQISPDHQAVVVINEKTGTIVIGQDVMIDTVAVAHGNISVSVTETAMVSQPQSSAFADAAGSTKVVDRTAITLDEEKAHFVVMKKQVTLQQLVNALNAVGAKPSDLIAVLQAVKTAGALHAELKVM